MKRMRRWAMVILVLSASLFVGVSWLFAQRLTRARPSAVGEPPNDFPQSVEPVSFVTSDEQTLSGWLVLGQDRKRAIVLLHGFGGDRRQMLPRARFFCE